MSMMNLLTMREISGLNIKPYFLISITKRHTFARQTIHLFYTKNEQILIIIQDMFVYFYLIHNISRHLQTIFQFLKSR